MSITIPETTTTSPDDPSYRDGRLDGELAAITRLPSRRAHARAAMAAPYDQAYADGYIDGFTDQTQTNAAIRLRNLLSGGPKEHQ